MVGWAELLRSAGPRLLLSPASGAGRRGCLGLLMRLLVEAGTPRELLVCASAHLLVLATADGGALIILTAATGSEAAMLAISLELEPPR